MLLELEIKRERREAKAEGKAEDILALLEDLGPVPEEVCETIMQEKKLNVLEGWLRLAARAKNMEEFLKGMKEF